MTAIEADGAPYRGPNIWVDYFAAMDEAKNFAQVALAWNELGLGLQVEVRGKDRAPGFELPHERVPDAGAHLRRDDGEEAGVDFVLGGVRSRDAFRLSDRTQALVVPGERVRSVCGDVAGDVGADLLEDRVCQLLDPGAPALGNELRRAGAL